MKLGCVKYTVQDILHNLHSFENNFTLQYIIGAENDVHVSVVIHYILGRQKIATTNYIACAVTSNVVCIGDNNGNF